MKVKLPLRHLLTNNETKQILQWQRDMLDQPVDEKIMIYQPILYEIQVMTNHAMERYREMEQERKEELQGYVSQVKSVESFDQLTSFMITEQTEIYSNISLLLDEEEKKFQSKRR